MLGRGRRCRAESPNRTWSHGPSVLFSFFFFFFSPHFSLLFFLLLIIIYYYYMRVIQHLIIIIITVKMIWLGHNKEESSQELTLGGCPRPPPPRRHITRMRRQICVIERFFRWLWIMLNYYMIDDLILNAIFPLIWSISSIICIS